MLRVKSDNGSSMALERSVPLKNIHIDARVRSFAADVTLTQIFENDESVPIEAVYCFPVEENAAIYQFIARIDDEREIVAELKEKKIAQQEYTQALADGHGVYLLEQDEASNDIFVVNVGALQPGSKCHIIISYVSELDLLHSNEKPTIRFVIPTTIAPRYSPTAQGITSPGGTEVKYVQSVPYTIQFTCHVDKLDQNIVAISSTSHPITVNLKNEEFFLVELSQENTQLDRDIIVDIELSQTRTNTIAAVEKGAVMVSFIPKEEDCQRNGNKTMDEFLFVIDCSSSMNDENKIGLAKKAMLLFLKSLPMKCRFNIVRFGSTYSPLFTNAVTREYNEINMLEAQRFIEDMTADLGGTELLQPLRWLKENQSAKGVGRQIFLLTDGEVSNVGEITNLCREMAPYARIFSFGLGHSPSRALVKGLARVTYGQSTFIPPNTNVDIHVAEQFARALQPSVTNVHLKWNSNQPILHTLPSHVPPVFFGDRLLFYALLDDSQPFDHTTRVELLSDKDSKSLGVAHIDHIPTTLATQTLMRLAAKAYIRELLDTDQPTAKENILDVSLKYGVLCPYTAFIGVERRLNGNNANMELREIPIMINPKRSRLDLLQNNLYESCTMKQSLNDILTRSMDLDSLCARSDSLSFEAKSFYKSTHSSRRSLMSVGDGIASIFQSTGNYISSLFNKNKTDPSKLPLSNSMNQNESADVSNKVIQTNSLSTTNNQSTEKLQLKWPTDVDELVSRFIELQRYDGLWLLTNDDIQQLTGKSFSDFSSSLIDAMGPDQQFLIITTVLILVLLEIRCASKKTLWQSLSNKSHQRINELFQNDQMKVNQLFQDIRDVFFQSSN